MEQPLGYADMPTDESFVLEEIGKIIGHHNPSTSKQSARNFYPNLELPERLGSYIRIKGLSMAAAARTLGMSPDALKRILDGGPLSENMLFRIKNAFEKAQQLTYPGDWKQTTARDVQLALSSVSEKLVFLKKVITTSNSLNAPESPIDRIQVAQLIALLDATLEAIKAPLLETKQARGFFAWLKRLGKRALEKGVEKKICEAIDQAADAGNEMIEKISNAPGSDDLGDLLF